MAASTLTIRSAPTLSGSSTSSRTGSGDRASTATPRAPGRRRDPVHDALGDRRCHGRETDRADLVGRVPGLDQESAEGAAPLVGRAVGIGREPPVRADRGPVEEAGGDLGVADVEGEQHGAEVTGSRRARPTGRVPARSSDAVPSGPRTSSAPSGPMPSATPAAGSAMRRPRSQSRRPSECAARPRSSRAVAGIERAQGGRAPAPAPPSGVASVPPSPSDAAVGAQRLGDRVPHVEPDADRRPRRRVTGPARLAEDAADLAVGHIRSLGHLSANVEARIGPLERVGDRQPRAQAQQLDAAPRAGRSRTLSQSPPRGGLPAPAPRSPPAVCSAATTAVPAGAPGSARPCSRSMVDGTASNRWSAGSEMRALVRVTAWPSRAPPGRRRSGTRRTPRSCGARRRSGTP